MTKLIDGCIPAFTECPYRKPCNATIQTCDHQSSNHQVPYSCAIARGFEIMDIRPKKRSAKSMVMQEQYASKSQRNRKKDYKRKDKWGNKYGTPT